MADQDAWMYDLPPDEVATANKKPMEGLSRGKSGGDSDPLSLSDSGGKLDGGGGGGGAKLVKKASSDIDKYMFEDDNDNLDIGSVMSSDVNSGFSLAEKAKELTDQARLSGRVVPEDLRPRPTSMRIQEVDVKDEEDDESLNLPPPPSRPLSSTITSTPAPAIDEVKPPAPPNTTTSMSLSQEAARPHISFKTAATLVKSFGTNHDHPITAPTPSPDVKVPFSSTPQEQITAPSASTIMPPAPTVTNLPSQPQQAKPHISFKTAATLVKNFGTSHTTTAAPTTTTTTTNNATTPAQTEPKGSSSSPKKGASPRKEASTTPPVSATRNHLSFKTAAHLVKNFGTASHKAGQDGAAGEAKGTLTAAQLLERAKSVRSMESNHSKSKSSIGDNSRRSGPPQSPKPYRSHTKRASQRANEQGREGQDDDYANNNNNDIPTLNDDMAGSKRSRGQRSQPPASEDGSQDIDPDMCSTYFQKMVYCPEDNAFDRLYALSKTAKKPPKDNNDPSFRPRLYTAKSQTSMRRSETTSSTADAISKRLYNLDGYIGKIKRNEELKETREKQLAESCTFKPKTSKRSGESAPKNDAEVWTRLYDRRGEAANKRAEVQQKAEEKRKADCPFQPQLMTKKTNKIDQADSKEPIHERLYGEAKEIIKRREELSKTLPTQCTFEPAVADFGDLASRSHGIDRVNELYDLGVRRVTEERIMEEAKKPVVERDDDEVHCTFHPVTNWARRGRRTPSFNDIRGEEALML